jgi:tRNA pseudouridine13 synthase
LAALIGSESIPSIVAFIDQGMKGKLELAIGTMDKAQRTHVHQLIATAYPGVESRTSPDGTGIVLLKATRNSRVRSEGRKYCHFVLHKAQKDTMSAVALLAKFLHLKPNRFAYAGIKDRRAVTTQWMSVDIEASQLIGLKPRLLGMRLGNFLYSDSPLHLGDLSGNRFTITLRNIQAADDVVARSMASFEQFGFINYFGLQRFGRSSAVPTHHIGRALLRDEFSKVVDLILGPLVGEEDETSRARQCWTESHDAIATMRLFPTKCIVERQLLQGLVAFPNDFQNAITGLPRNMRMLYGHAYQVC